MRKGIKEGFVDCVAVPQLVLLHRSSDSAGLREDTETGGVKKCRDRRMTIMLDHFGGGCDVERVEREVASVIPRKTTYTARHRASECIATSPT